MNFVLIGTDHRLQSSDPGYEALLHTWLSIKYFEPLDAIAEEYHDGLGPSIAKQLAEERGLRWYNLDMTTEEKCKAGILTEQFSRPGKFQDAVTYRMPSDEVRENAWLEKLVNSGSQTTLVICGYLHFGALLEKLRAGGHVVDTRVYLEVVPQIRTE